MNIGRAQKYAEKSKLDDSYETNFKHQCQSRHIFHAPIKIIKSVISSAIALPHNSTNKYRNKFQCKQKTHAIGFCLLLNVHISRDSHKECDVEEKSHKMFGYIFFNFHSAAKRVYALLCWVREAPLPLCCSYALSIYMM